MPKLIIKKELRGKYKKNLWKKINYDSTYKEVKFKKGLYYLSFTCSSI